MTSVDHACESDVCACRLLLRVEASELGLERAAHILVRADDLPGCLDSLGVVVNERLGGLIVNAKVLGKSCAA